LPQPLAAEEKMELRGQWGIPADAPLILAGSTHPREERLIWTAFQQVRERHPRTALVIAPRHPERFTAVAEELASVGAIVHRTSTGAPAPPGTTVVILDQMGVLARSFGAADVALVGGAWNPIGGHNLLEPAAHGIPVVHGPGMHAQREIMRILRQVDGSIEVKEEELGGTLTELLSDPGRSRACGHRGFRAALANRGAARRAADLITTFLAKRE
jgi:3-deoxy-D-manno-octulosonic-acid transferase